MKKSKTVELALVTSLIVACNVSNAQTTEQKERLHLRGDTTEKYTRVNHYYGGGVPYFYYFHPNGVYNNSGYHKTSYSSKSISHSSRSHSGHVSRGGFGGSHGGMHVSS